MALHLPANRLYPSHSSPSPYWYAFTRLTTMRPLSSEVEWSTVGIKLEASEGQRRPSLVIPGDAWFDDRINVLNRDVVKASPAQQVYRMASDILALVRVSALVLLPSVDPHW